MGLLATGTYLTVSSSKAQWTAADYDSFIHLLFTLTSMQTGGAFTHSHYCLAEFTSETRQAHTM